MPSKTFKVLIADDDANLVKILALQLQKEGFEVVTARDGYFAFDLAVKESPDLFILDINMPAGTGFTVQNRICRLPKFDNVPVIYITGDKSDEAKNAARKFGAFATVYKPIEMPMLLETVRRALGLGSDPAGTG